MEDFVKRIIQEHHELVKKIEKLEVFINNQGETKNPFLDISYYTSEEAIRHNINEYANMCIQLAHMKCYASALVSRLNSNGIFVTSDGYFAEIKPEDKDIATQIDIIVNAHNPKDETSGSDNK